MSKYQSLKLLEEEFGEPLKSGWTGETLYYAMDWAELQALAEEAARKENSSAPTDVRSAGYALDLLGIPYQHIETEPDGESNWVVYWR